jgi:hypothetical protein
MKRNSITVARHALTILAVLVVGFSPSVSSAVVMSGHAAGVTPLVNTYTWGVAPNALTGGFSYESSTLIWVYGDRVTWGFEGINADVYNAGPIDPGTVSDATVFTYSDPDFPVGSVAVGDVVFFRGDNGYYGAWVITSMTGTVQTVTIDFDWYYQTDGTGNFNGALPTEPSTWGAVKQLYR